MLEIPTQSEMSESLTRLSQILLSYGRVAVAFSGGVDSTFVAAMAYRTLRADAIAITADSPSVPRAEIALTQKIAAEIGIQHIIVQTKEFENPDYLQNDGARCYFCKSELYSTILQLQPSMQFQVICSGANVDDLGDYRPGLTAAKEKPIRHPLIEAEFNKQQVRAAAKELKLSIWEKPASPCLSSRIAPGLPVTIERTSKIEQAEAFLKEMGVTDCRVRLHPGELARVEVPLSWVPKIFEAERFLQIEAKLKSLGFQFVTLDLSGLRSGSMNQLVQLETKKRFANPGVHHG